jgi:hypothetical protein
MRLSTLERGGERAVYQPVHITHFGNVLKADGQGIRSAIGPGSALSIMEAFSCFNTSFCRLSAVTFVRHQSHLEAPPDH